jgi:hypothetical protein
MEMDPMFGTNQQPTINGREVIQYPAGFPDKDKITFASLEDARDYRGMYLLGLYCSPFGGDDPTVNTPGNAPHGVDDAGFAKLHPDDDVNPFEFKRTTKKRRKK